MSAINSLRTIALKSLSPQLRRLHTSKTVKDVFTATDSVMPQPHRATPVAFLGVTVASVSGIYVGGIMSMHIAALLEENEIFTPQDDEDDD